jgi:YspA, cpYpsA-related SLOG family
MKVLVTGGRDFADAALLAAALDSIHAEQSISLLIHGDPRGADRLAAAWADVRQIPLLAFPADWNAHGRAAGFIRNARMLAEASPELVIAFPGGKGTAHMVGVAIKAGVPVRRIG